MGRKLFFNIVIFFASFSVGAQISQNNTGSLNDLAFFVNINNPKHEGAQGSRYIFDAFVSAKINDIPTTQTVRFNVVDNIIEFKDAKGDIKALSLRQDYTITLLNGSNRIFVTKEVADRNGVSKTTFLEQVHSNKDFQLYKKERIRFEPSKPPKSSYEKALPAKFVRLEDTFFVQQSGVDELIQIPKKKKGLKTFFGKYYYSILAFTKENGLGFDSAENLVMILNHYYLLIK